MRRTLAALAVVTVLVAGACGGEATPATTAGSSSPAVGPSPTPSPSAIPIVEPEDELCARVGEMEMRLGTLRAVPLTLPNRTSVEIEYDKLVATFEELQRTDLGDLEGELEDSLTRLGYRMGELNLAVEDFRTNPRPRRAVPHVEEDSQKVFDELRAFVILSRC